MSYTTWFSTYIIIYTHTHTADSLNSSSLDVIERAQFILCLNQGHRSTSSLPPHSLFSDTVLVNRCLHGGGSEFSSGNRWFDSGIQVCYCVHTLWYHIWNKDFFTGWPFRSSVHQHIAEIHCRWEFTLLLLSLSCLHFALDTQNSSDAWIVHIFGQQEDHDIARPWSRYFRCIENPECRNSWNSRNSWTNKNWELEATLWKFVCAHLETKVVLEKPSSND